MAMALTPSAAATYQYETTWQHIAALDVQRREEVAKWLLVTGNGGEPLVAEGRQRRRRHLYRGDTW